MKNLTLALVILLQVAIFPKLFSQNVAVNSTGTMPDTSAMLDVSSNSKGFLMPRMTTAEQNAIILPAKSLMIFNTSLNNIMVNTGTSASPVWTALSTAGVIDTSSIANFYVKVRSLTTSVAPITLTNGQIGITQSGTASNGYLSNTDWNTFNNKADATTSWSTLGNNVASVQKIGTTSNFDFPFITNNTEKMRLLAGGNFGIGIAAPTAVLHLKAGTASAGTAPLKFNTGPLLTTAETGAVEFLTDKFYGTITTGAARKEFTLNDIGLTATYVPYVTTNGRLTNIASFTYSGTRLSPKYITLSAGAAAAGSAPLIFTSGPLLTTPVAGAMEFLTDNPTFTITTGLARKEFTLNEVSLVSGRIPVITTNGRLTSNANFNWDNLNSRLGVVQATPTAYLHLGSGGSAANSAPLKFTTGTLLTTPETGAVEFSGTHFYATVGTTRFQLDQQVGTTYSGSNGVTLTGNNFTNDLITGIAGGQTVVGGTASGNSLTLSSTSHATKGNILFGTSAYDEVNNQLGLGNTAPTEKLDVTGNIKFSGALMPNNVAGAAGTFLSSNGAGASPTWVSFDTSNIPLFSQKVRSLFSATAPITYTNGLFGITQSSSTTDGYLSAADWNTFNGKADSANTWHLGGNSVASAQNMGTTSNFDLPFITNNTEKMRLSSGGNLGVGASVVDGVNAEKLLVDAGTNSYNVISGKGNLNSYLQLNIKNINAGTAASSDVVATNDAGTEANGLNYVDMGVNSSGNTSTGVIGGANTGYLYSTGSDFSIGNATASKNLLLFTGGTASANERMRIDGSGNVGIGTSSPSTKLHIYGTNPLTLTGVQTGTTTSADSVLTITSGLVQKLPVSTFVTSGNIWSIGGNSVASAQNIGTTTNFDFPFITNNTERMRLSAGGNLGIGASVVDGTNAEKLLVDAGTTSYNVISGKGNLNSYLQLNIKNTNAGTAASSDVVATNDAGTEANGLNFVDMGVNSSGNTSTGVLGGANTGYLYSTGSDFSIGNATASKNLLLFTGGTAAANERMRIDGSGNVGIGTTSPSSLLHVNGTNPLTLTGVQTGANTDSILTIINGTVKKLSPSALTTSSSNAWALIGNASTNPGTNFIGTTDAKAIVVKENNTQVGRFEANSIALGNGAAVNTATNSYAMGTSSSISFGKTNAIAIGNSSSVSNDNAFALGNSASTTASNAFAIGNSATSNSSNSFAIGPNASNAYSIADGIAIGDNATTSASNSIAIGSNSTAANKTQTNAASAIAIGNTTTANSANAIAMGTSATTGYSATSSISIGNGTIANSNNAIAMGTSASTGFSLTNPVAIGVSSLVNGNNGVAIGNGSTVGFVSNSTALGAGTSVSGTNSTGVGYNADVTQDNALVLGDITNTSLSVGIGSETFTSGNREKLLVDAGTTSYNVISGKGNLNSYLQLNIKNTNAGTAASSDVVATNDAGTEANGLNYVDMGVNSSGNTSTGVLGGANTGYLYSTGSDFAIGNATASQSLLLFTGGTASTNERMRINGSGSVGIATTSPTAKLDVAGTYKLGTAGTVLNSMIKTNVTVGDATTFTYQQTKTYTVALTGATVNGSVIINPRSALPAGISIAWTRVSSSDVLTIAFTNSDTTAKAVGSITYDVTVIQ